MPRATLSKEETTLRVVTDPEAVVGQITEEDKHGEATGQEAIRNIIADVIGA